MFDLGLFILSSIFFSPNTLMVSSTFLNMWLSCPLTTWFYYLCNSGSILIDCSSCTGYIFLLCRPVMFDWIMQVNLTVLDAACFCISIYILELCSRI